MHPNEATLRTGVVMGQALQVGLFHPGRMHTLTTKLPQGSPKPVPGCTQPCLVCLTDPLLQVSYPQQVVVYACVGPRAITSPQDGPNILTGVKHRLIGWVMKGQPVWTGHRWRCSSVLTAHAKKQQPSCAGSCCNSVSGRGDAGPPETLNPSGLSAKCPLRSADGLAGATGCCRR